MPLAPSCWQAEKIGCIPFRIKGLEMRFAYRAGEFSKLMMHFGNMTCFVKDASCFQSD